jgi:hypothetical protein
MGASMSSGKSCHEPLALSRLLLMPPNTAPSGTAAACCEFLRWLALDPRYDCRNSPEIPTTMLYPRAYRMTNRADGRDGEASFQVTLFNRALALRSARCGFGGPALYRRLHRPYPFRTTECLTEKSRADHGSE